MAALQDGPGRNDPLVIETTQTALDKDQSSLVALDINGLVELNAVAMLLMSVACVAIFVFGLLMARRREYVMLRAVGMAERRLLALVLGETAIVAVGGVLVGTVVGLAMAQVFVRVLRPLFVLDPQVTLEPGRLMVLLVIPLVATVVSGLAATAMLRPDATDRAPAGVVERSWRGLLGRSQRCGLQGLSGPSSQPRIGSVKVMK